MAEINLLKDFGLSLADIHRREQPVPEEQANMGAAAVIEETSPKTFALVLFGALAGLGVAAVALVVFFKVVLAPIPASLPYVRAPENTAVDNTGGYERIQLIEFTGENTGSGGLSTGGAELLAGSPAQVAPESNMQALAESSAPTQPTPPPLKAEPAVQTAPEAAPRYALTAADLSEASYQRLKNTAENMNVKLSTTSKAPELWAVYVPSEVSEMVLQGIPVSRSDAFETRAAAVSFAETLSDVSTVFVVKTEGTDRRYSASACCLEYADAGILAKKAGIGSGTYKLVKQ